MPWLVLEKQTLLSARQRVVVFAREIPLAVLL
jgi:hypothetical protein